LDARRWQKALSLAFGPIRLARNGNLPVVSRSVVPTARLKTTEIDTSEMVDIAPCRRRYSRTEALRDPKSSKGYRHSSLTTGHFKKNVGESLALLGLGIITICTEPICTKKH
jgi:hypothetical protein